MWADECARLRLVGERYGVDALLLGAIRLAENGRPGREFGVLSVPAPDWDSQASACAATVRGVLARTNVKAFRRVPGAGGVSRLAYSPAAIGELGRRYAPIGAENDPTGLNLSWVRNVSAIYERLCRDGLAG